MGYFPRPLPDEVIGSLFANACGELGLSPSTLLRKLTGISRGYSSFLSSSLLRKFGKLTGLDAEELLWEHTVFPYVVAFMPGVDVTRFRDKALDPLGRRLDCFGSLTKSVSHALPFRRMCTQCIADDLARHGRSYWHRAHQLPAVYHCNIHAAVLLHTEIGVRNEMRRVPLEMPEEVPGREVHLPLPADVLEAVHQRSLAALSRRTGHREDWLAWYRSRASEKGYGMPGGDLASQQLAMDLLELFTESFLMDTGCGFRARRESQWPALMVRERVGIPFAPAKHVLLDTYLYLCNAGDTQRAYEKPGKKPSDPNSEDQRCLAKMTRILQRVVRAGHRITVKQLLGDAGYWEAYRHNRERYPLSRAFIEQFKASDFAERQIGRRPYWRERLGLGCSGDSR